MHNDRQENRYIPENHQGGVKMGKTKKRTFICLILSIALMLISMVGAHIVQTDGGKVTIKDISWETPQGYVMSALLCVPEGVSAENPAPGIVTSHGMYNNKEMQDINYVELARRGYVVLAMDMYSHGNSENVDDLVTVQTGMYDAVQMLASLDYVDTEHIGITGHSLGGISSNVAVTLDNAADTQLISAVLLNCADATYVDSETGEYTDIYGSRDVGIIAAQYDEFFMQSTDAEGNVTGFAPDYLESSNAQSFLYFGTDPTGQELRTEGEYYYENVDGEEAFRVIYNPDIIHPWSHFSQKSATATINFFNEAFGMPDPIPASDQIWQWKEAFNAVGLVGFAMFVIYFTISLLYTPAFSSLRSKEVIVGTDRKATKKGKLWFWLGLILSAVFGTALYIPLLTNMQIVAYGLMPWAQSAPWGVSTWALLCGLFAIAFMAVSYFVNGKKEGTDLKTIGVKISLPKLGKTILLAVIVICMSFFWVFFADYFFNTDFRLWVLAIKAFGTDKILVSFFPYMVFFLVYYVANSVANNSFNLNDIGMKDGKRGWINTAIVTIFNALPPVILLVYNYSYYFMNKTIRYGSSTPTSMAYVWLFPIAVILPVSAVISRKIYKMTNNPYLAGIINGVIITLITCSNTLTYAF